MPFTTVARFEFHHDEGLRLTKVKRYGRRFVDGALTYSNIKRFGIAVEDCCAIRVPSYLSQSGIVELLMEQYY